MSVKALLKVAKAAWLMECHCLQAMKIVHHHANGHFDWLISEHQSVNPSREAISILSGKYQRFMFVHPVLFVKIIGVVRVILVRLWEMVRSSFYIKYSPP